MPGNRAVTYLGPGKVEVQSIDYPKLQNPEGKTIEHGVILRIVSTNICGSDQHMVRGRTTAPRGLVLGHEITGEVIERGKDVEFIDIGDLVSVPFNVACGRCRTCREQQTGVCLNVNPSRAGGAYGYVDMGGWIGGQAEYVMVPYADFNLLKFPDKEQALSKIRDLTMLSDILPTGFHGALSAGVEVGSTVYVAGAGPVGLAAAASAQILGAAVVMIGDMNDERLKHAEDVGFEPIDLKQSDKLEDLIESVIGVPEVDASVDAVGFEAHAYGAQHGTEAPAVVLNSLMSITRAAGGIGTFPDFTQCRQTTPELNKDWKATITYGGAGRGFSRIMPSFGEALTSGEIDAVIEYLRGFCTDKKWPRGEFNLPLPQFTEKAFPEDEVIITSHLNAQRAPGVSNDIISENTFGARTQLEVDAPIDFIRSAPGLWHGGIGDATIGLKQVIFANLDAGSILSGFGGIIVPSGSTAHGLGAGVTQFESFAAFAQILPSESFVQLQAGTDQPTDPSKAPRSLFWRSAFGKTFRQQNGLGRMWTPMVELVANKDFLPHTTPDWDIVPQLQVTLSARQHVRINLGTSIPVTNTSNRPIQVVFYVLWDWFDGSLLKGWK